jgi:hypothetical protein
MWRIKTQTGHRSDSTLGLYIRNVGWTEQPKKRSCNQLMMHDQRGKPLNSTLERIGDGASRRRDRTLRA